MTVAALVLSTLASVPIHAAPAPAPSASAGASLQGALPCVVETRWLNDDIPSIDRSAPLPLVLFTATSTDCGATTTLSAAYFDRQDRLVCSGTVSLTIPVNRTRPYRHIELNAGNVYQFLRWVNGPSRTARQWSALECRTPDDTGEVHPTALAGASRLRLHATTRAPGDIGTTEVTLELR